MSSLEFPIETCGEWVGAKLISAIDTEVIAASPWILRFTNQVVSAEKSSSESLCVYVSRATPGV